MEKNFETFKSNFINKYSELYKPYFGNYLGILMEEFRLDIEVYNNGEIEIIHKKVLRSVYNLKWKWAERYKNNKKYAKEIEGIKLEYEKVTAGIRTLDEFRNYYNIKSDKHYIETTINDVKVWRDNPKARLSGFPFLYNLDKRLVKTAFKYDVLIEYYYFLNNKQDTTVAINVIRRIPAFLDMLAIDPTNKKKLIDDKTDVNIDGQYIEIFSHISAQQKEHLLVELEKDAYLKLKQGKNVQDIVTQMALLKATDTMNSYDSKILSYIYTCFYNDILAESIIKQPHEILFDIGIDNNTSNRNKVINSILKLSKLNLEYKVNTEHLSGSLFDVYITKDPENRENKIKIQLGPFFKSLIYMNEGYNFNKKAYDNLNSDSQHYALWFQKRRIKLCREGSKSEWIHINNVLGAILWNTVRYDRRLKRVITALEELKENKLIIKDFKYNKKLYEVEIKYLELPLAIQEKIKNHDFKTSEIVEGDNYVLK